MSLRKISPARASVVSNRLAEQLNRNRRIENESLKIDSKFSPRLPEDMGINGSLTPFYSSKQNELEEIATMVPKNERDFQFNIYSDSVDIDPKSKTVTFFTLAPNSVIFEVRSQGHPIGKKYISDSFPTSQLFDEWDSFYPSSQAQPNAFINGFDSEGARRLFTLTLSNPQFDGDNVTFNYRLDKIEGVLDVDNTITEWDGREPLTNVSTMIDATTNQYVEIL